MAKKRQGAEQIIPKLREAEVELASLMGAGQLDLIIRRRPDSVRFDKSVLIASVNI